VDSTNALTGVVLDWFSTRYNSAKIIIYIIHVSGDGTMDPIKAHCYMVTKSGITSATTLSSCDREGGATLVQSC
jgi:hypothetical protein